ncbi:mechanosensitive ion channel [Candidatus Pacearchaeota archaeon]|nr:mechanosensitive ion channel [Candidatus Pacearchaeota archaeon]
MVFEFKKFMGYFFLALLAGLTATILYLKRFLPELFSIIPNNLESIFNKILISILILSLLKILMNIISKISTKEMEKRKVNDQEIFFMQSLFRIVFWIISLFVVLSVFFESIGSLITAFGLIGAGLAIALQHPILNLTGWVIILFNKPFLVGDRIEIEHTGFEIRGDVVDIGPLYTKIRKLGKNDEHTGKVIMVPNEILIINSVTNYSKGTGFIWDRVSFSMTYESDIKKAKELVLEATESVLSMYKKFEAKEMRKFTDNKAPEKPFIWIDLKDSWILVGATYLVESKIKLKTRAEISEAIYDLVKKQKNIHFAYPHLHIVKD